MADRDILLDEEGRMVIRDGRLATGPSLSQEVGLLMLTSQGEIKRDVFCGCNLRARTNTRLTASRFLRIVKAQAERDGKDWPSIRDGINLRING